MRNGKYFWTADRRDFVASNPRMPFQHMAQSLGVTIHSVKCLLAQMRRDEGTAVEPNRELRMLRNAHPEFIAGDTKPPLPILKYPTSREVMRVVCAFYKITEIAFKSRSRMSYLVRARMVAGLLCSEYCDVSIAGIGREFNRDHTTIMHNIRSIKERLPGDNRLADEVGVLRLRIVELWPATQEAA